MTKMPDKKDFLSNLKEMIQLELDQAKVFAEILSLIENSEFQKYRDTCQQMRQDELLHARKLQEIKSLIKTTVWMIFFQLALQL